MSDLPNPRDLDALAGPVEDSGPPVQTTLADLPGQLKEWLGGVAGRMGDWARDAAIIVNDFLTRRDIADASAVEAEQFAQSVQTFAGGLDEVVRADPTATNMALGLAALTVPAIIGDHPHLTDEERGPLAERLAGEVGQSIARNAVLSWAQRDPDMARAEMQRLDKLIPPEQKAALADHVDLLEIAQQRDREAAAIQAANDRADESHRRSMAYTDQIIRPDGTSSFPLGWVQRVVNDQGVTPEDTSQLMRTMQSMQERAAMGVPPQSNGIKFGDFIGMARAGRGGWTQLWDQVINGNLAPQAAQALARASPTDLTAIETFYQNARKAAIGPDGDLTNPQTSDALGKKMETMLSAYSRWGVGALDPNDPNFFGAMRKNFSQTALDQRIEIERKADRLADIFAKRQAQQRFNAEKQAAEFDLRQQIGEARREETDFTRQVEREERAREQEYRRAIRAANAQQHAEIVAAQTRARLEAAQQPHATEAPRTGGAGRPPAPRPADTFRRFLSLGRPERV